jgi:short-subunit dehydrogenase
MREASSPEVVVITGASAGVGRAVVREFARRQAKIGLIARDFDGLDAARQEVEAAGGQALVLPTDVADAAAVERAAAVVEEAFGPIDVWINNAMVTVFSPVMAMKAEEYRRVTEVTYLGYVYGTLAALKRMKPRDHGVILQVGSALSYRAIPLQSAYCAAKHAIKGFTESLRSELFHDDSKVRVTMVHLPAVNTPQFEWGRNHLDHAAQPVPPIYQPEVPARAIYWAAHHDRRELWVGFSTAKAILGERFVPGLLDRYLARQGYRGQLLPEPHDPNDPGNLMQCLPGDHGAHGPFDRRARSASLQVWADQNRGVVALAGLGLAGLAAWAARRSA